MQGQVYFVKNSEGHCKIGMTYNLQSRFSQLQVSSSTPLELMFVIHSDKPDVLEQELHRRFQHKWVRGEWFLLDNDDFNALLNEVNHHVFNQGHQDSVIRASAFDVRPLSRRQQYTTAKRREDVSHGGSAFDHARREPVFAPVRGEHQIGVSPVLRQERQDDSSWNSELHDDRTVRCSDIGEWTADLLYGVERSDSTPQKRSKTSKGHTKQQAKADAQMPLEFGF